MFSFRFKKKEPVKVQNPSLGLPLSVELISVSMTLQTSMMDSVDKDLYKRMKSKLKNGEYFDVQGNISLLFVYAYELLEGWKKTDFQSLSDYLILLSEMYFHEPKFSNYCVSWSHDCLLAQNRYEEYLVKTEPTKVVGTATHHANLRLNIQRHLGQKANPIDLLQMYGGRKTKFITENELLYRDKIFECFEEYSEKNLDLMEQLNEWSKNQKTYPSSLFTGAVISQNPKLGFEINSFYSSTNHAEIVKDLLKESESRARKSIGLPGVGEGWMAETALFLKIKNEFPETQVIQHGRPQWLGRQHFDIWIPRWNIAVEYHGEQHFEPIDFFGGKEGFKQNVKRDKRKSNLATKNGVDLIVVTKDSDQISVMNNLKALIESKRQLAIKLNDR